MLAFDCSNMIYNYKITRIADKKNRASNTFHWDMIGLGCLADNQICQIPCFTCNNFCRSEKLIQIVDRYGIGRPGSLIV